MESVMYRRPWILFFLTCVEALRTDNVVGGANKDVAPSISGGWCCCSPAADHCCLATFLLIAGRVQKNFAWLSKRRKTQGQTVLTRADAATPSRRYSHSCRLFLTTSGRGSKTLNPARVSSLDECRTFHRCWSLGRVQTPRLSCLTGVLVELQGAGEQLVGVERLIKQNCRLFDEEVPSLRPLPSSASRSWVRAEEVHEPVALILFHFVQGLPDFHLTMPMPALMNVLVMMLIGSWTLGKAMLFDVTLWRKSWDSWFSQFVL